MDQESKTLVIIGAGPKALALATKAKALHDVNRDFDLKLPVPNIVIVEKDEIGANWSGGNNGFTDGTPMLRRTIERDIGYPYKSTIFYHANYPDLPAKVNAAMRRFSWQSYLIAKEAEATEQGYTDWIDRGHRVINHKRLQKYLLWLWSQVATEESEGSIQLLLGCTVQSVRVVNNKWSMQITGQPDKQDQFAKEILADGVVFTGPGDIRERFLATLKPESGYFNAQSFWRHWPGLLDKLEKQRRDRSDIRINVGLIGAGDAAASIAVTLLDQLKESINITIFAPHGTVYSRGENYTETRFYSDPNSTNWEGLTLEHRADFIRRTDRAVFSQQAQQRLNEAPNVDYLPGSVTDVQQIEYKYDYDEDDEGDVDDEDDGQAEVGEDVYENAAPEADQLLVYSEYPRNSGTLTINPYHYVIYAVSVKPVSTLLDLLDVDTLKLLPLKLSTNAVEKLLQDARIYPDLGNWLRDYRVLDRTKLDQDMLVLLRDRNKGIAALLDTAGISGDLPIDGTKIDEFLFENPALEKLFQNTGVFGNEIVNMTAFMEAFYELIKNPQLNKPLKDAKGRQSARTLYERLEEIIDQSLQFSIDRFLKVEDMEPPLHLPMLAGLQKGPGFPGLSCLGLLSDRILFYYMQSAFPPDS